MSDDTNQMNRQLREFMMVRHEVFADVAIVAICTNKYRPIHKCTILEMGAYPAFDLFYPDEILAILDVQTICENITKFLAMQAKSSLRRGNSESCVAGATLVSNNADGHNEMDLPSFGIEE